jgi:hypothetical protein
MIQSHQVGQLNQHIEELTLFNFQGKLPPASQPFSRNAGTGLGNNWSQTNTRTIHRSDISEFSEGISPAKMAPLLPRTGSVTSREQAQRSDPQGDLAYRRKSYRYPG